MPQPVSSKHEEAADAAATEPADAAPSLSFADLFFSFRGRIGIGEYLAGTLFLFIAAVLAFASLIDTPNPIVLVQPSPSLVRRIAIVLLGVVLVWSALALAAKRLHDIDMSGMTAVGLFIPVVNLIVFLMMCFTRSSAEENQWGRTMHWSAPS